VTDLWVNQRRRAARAVEPLAVRMRPRSIDEVVGQRHLLGPGRLLRRMIDADALSSIILFGPPGTGKTTLAEVIAAATNRHFERENAAAVGVARIRQVIQEAEARLADSGRRTVLFLDEIHRFSRSQQDVLLGDVERGLITLIGATTENPLFSVNSALVSRSTLLRLEPLSEEDVVTVLRRAIADPERGYGRLDLTVTDDALKVWAVKSDGDARRALNALEVAVLSQGKGVEVSAEGVEVSRCQGVKGMATATPSTSRNLDTSAPVIIDRQAAEDSIQQKAAVYSGTGDEHYDSISAMIKSVRGSDPDAAVYWIARMLDAGEDPRFIARRLAILASEDVGNADPRGIMVAAAAWDLVERIGMPEARITLAQAATYLALAPKSNAAYLAIDAALADVKEGRTIPVPVFLKDPNARRPVAMSDGGREALARTSGAGQSYVYTHDLQAVAGVGGVSGQDYLGVEKEYYRPTDLGAEKQMKERLAEIRRIRRERSRDAGP
jgi:putative ATPase